MLEERFLKPRLTKVGMIRAGLSPKATGKKHPTKLQTLRFTSAAEHLIREIARLYGGEPKQWQHPSQGRQWEVITDTDTVPVMVPKQAIDAWFELWGANTTLQRRCTGAHVTNLNRPCLCDPAGTMGRDDPRRTCKVVTRLSLLLAEVPGLVAWGIESHGWNAVDEWGRYSSMIENMDDSGLWPARLQLQKRSSNVVDENDERQAREYMVPVVLFDLVTAQQFAAGASGVSAALAGQRQAVEGGQRAAIEAAPPAAIEAAVAPEPDRAVVLSEAAIASLVRWIGKTTTAEGLMKVKTGVIDKYEFGLDHPVMVAWLAARERVLAAAQQPAAEPARPRTATYADVMTEAGRLKWSTGKVNAAIEDWTGTTPAQATPAQLGEALTRIEAL